MKLAVDDQHNRLLPLSAEEFYKMRHRLARAADEMRVAVSNGAVSPLEVEDWWLEVTNALARLDSAWHARQPNLRVVG